MRTVLLCALLALFPVSAALAGDDDEPRLVATIRSAPGESMDAFAVRIAPAALDHSMRLSGEVCGEFRRDGASLVLALYTTRCLRQSSYRRPGVHDYTGLTFHTHAVIGEKDPRSVQAKLMSPRSSDHHYDHPGYLASGRRVLFQAGLGSERELRALPEPDTEHSARGASRLDLASRCAPCP